MDPVDPDPQHWSEIPYGSAPKSHAPTLPIYKTMITSSAAAGSAASAAGLASGLASLEEGAAAGSGTGGSRAPRLVKYSLASSVTRSRIHERTISLRFLGIILRVLRLEISMYHVYITNQFQSTFAQGVGGSKILQ